MLTNITRHVLTLRHPFSLATGVSEERVSFSLQIEDAAGHRGRGEATPLHYRGETPDDLASELEQVSLFLGERRDVFEAALTAASQWRPGDEGSPLEAADALLRSAFPEARAALAAVDAALYDLLGQRAEQPLHELFGLDDEALPPCSFTCAESDVTRVKERAKEALAEGFTHLKIKVGQKGADDVALVAAVRDIHSGPLLIDANGGWTEEQAIQRIRELSRFEPGLIEQPIPAGDPDALRRIKDATNVPLFADEDSLDLDDLGKLVGAVDGVNVKLMKCGGLDEALRMIGFARRQGWKIVLGCMIESSLGISAAAHLAPLVDHADLDGAALIANDPYVGAALVGGRLRLPKDPGLGVRPRAEAAG